MAIFCANFITAFTESRLCFARNINPVMRIVIIGTGNTATVLGRLIQRSGHTVLQVIGRTYVGTERLGNRLHAPFTNESKEINTAGDLYILAVSDNAISQVASWLKVDKKLVVHTAGSVDSEVLSGCSKNYGVLYPLQSLRKEMDELPQVPFLVEGNTEDNGALIYDFASTMSENVQFATAQQRRITHIAAIIASNFTNHLYVLAEDFCNRENIDFDLLRPLIRETALRLERFSPTEMQTGPASRNDTETITKHLGLLDSYPIQKSVYEFLTDSILKSKEVRK